MTINLAKPEEILQQKLNNITTNDVDILPLFRAAKSMNTGVVYNVANTASLPTSPNIKLGAFYYIESDNKLYYYNDIYKKWVIASGPNRPLYTWGYNVSGQLGDGTTTSKTSPGTTVSIGSWKQVSLGFNFAGAVKTDGTLWTWGNNTSGCLGDGTTTSRSSPGNVAGGGTTWSLISCGGTSLEKFTAAIKTDGTLWTWGVNTYGQLGTGNTTGRSSPGTTASGGTDWAQISCGYQHIAAIKTDGTLWGCGINATGELGDGTITSRTSPVTTAGGGTTWSQVSAKNQYTMAVKTDGTLWGWGRNLSGSIGDGTAVSKTSPVTTAGGGTNWSLVATGYQHTAAIKTDGTLWTWGNNASGRLGDGTTTSRSSPGTTAGAGTTWQSVAPSRESTVALKTDGILWSWGYNIYGQLGDGTTTSRSSPGTTASTFTDWANVSAGYYNSAGIRHI